ncbi:AraC family transcriptional regulator [Sphingobacterium ginsenosidimutans]|uniref:AraC family transcriptional regulator n=1 Tax=Sphingobacterium ginsenosidimutans TaxID=687845 RepID=UPI0031F7A041
MKTLIQKIHVEEQYSFACRTYRTPTFETAWHRHPECELIVITEGNGTALIGDYIGDYKQGDVFFLGSDLPHWFRKSRQDAVGSAIVVHFLKDFWGTGFLALPEMHVIAGLLKNDSTGIQLIGNLAAEIDLMIRKIENTEGLERIQLLLNCMEQIGSSEEHKVITMAFDTIAGREGNIVIEAIIDYSFKNFLNPISLEEVASSTNMSVSAFCRFFKKNIKKSYFDFIKELRIGHACKLLRDTDRPILDICYNSGYNSWAHFSKQFKVVTKASPLKYRKQFRTG